MTRDRSIAVLCLVVACLLFWLVWWLTPTRRAPDLTDPTPALPVVILPTPIPAPTLGAVVTMSPVRPSRTPQRPIVVNPSPPPEVILLTPPLPTATPIPPLVILTADTPTVLPTQTAAPERSPIQKG